MVSSMLRVLHIEEGDNVVNALSPLEPGQIVEVEGLRVIVRSHIPIGHKMSIKNIPKGNPVVKYGEIIGYASIDIQIGDHVHIENVEDPISKWKDQYLLLSVGETDG